MEATITEIVPLQYDDNGVIRVGDTRVPLETVISSFEQGATAEQIAYQFPALRLADIYTVIAYYLNHREDVQHYMHRVEDEEDKMSVFTTQHFEQTGIRQRLLARKLNN
jgi:uncharacterized protein (DUF433 family)